MLVLAIETATDTAAVALADDGGVIATVSVMRPRRHAETVAPAVADVCRYAGVPLSAVSALAVDVGPGLFTGLRVGVGSARALSFALDVPVVAVGSLEILAVAAAQTVTVGRPIVPVVDARRGEVFWAPYRAGSAADSDSGSAAGGALEREANAEGPDRASDAPTLAAALGALDEPALVVGDGARRYAETLGAGGAEVAGAAFSHPPVAVLAALGVHRAGAGLGTGAAAVLPRYLRDADARINWETRRRPAPARTPA